MHSLLQLVSPSGRRSVEATALTLIQANEPWATRLLGVKGVRACENLAFIGAAIHPGLGHDRLTVWLKLCLWTFLLDDRLDNPNMTECDLSNVERVIEEALVGGCVDDVMGVGLCEVTASLKGYDRDGVWIRLVADGLRQGVTAGIAHSKLSRQVRQGLMPQPVPEQYLEVASRSINYRVVVTALLLLVGSPPLSASDLSTLDQAVSEASRAIRLANDLCSVTRDQEEGILNVLLLRRADGSAVTPSDVRAEIVRHVDAHDKATSLITGSSSVPEILQENLRLSVGAYRIGDLR